MAQKIAEEVYWTGVNDYTNDLFEGIWPIPDGVTINSYIVRGDKTAIIDIVKSSGGGSSASLNQQFKSVGIEPEHIDYIILNHLEPDHTGFLPVLHKYCPNAEIITSKKGVKLVEAFYHISENIRGVGDGDTLDLGKGKILHFYDIPNVHWPETMVTFEESTGVLFSCDAFGSFGAFKGTIFADEIPKEDIAFFEGETLRYYANIVAAFSAFVLKAIDKLGSLLDKIKIIAPSHGLIWRNPMEIIERYQRYANYANDYGEPEITVIWGSMYSNTEVMLRAILRGIAKEGVKVTIHKVPETHVSNVLASAWRSAGIVIGMPTYEYSVFPPMAYVLDLMKLKRFKHKKVMRFGSYGWVGGAEKGFEERIKNLNWDVDSILEFQGGPTNEDLRIAEEKAAEFARSIKEIPKKLIS
ncbi:MAG: FprA family A-type flavoprotein [Candidatus Lokiarchaeota archaeon]|nr:FprA family A-type flavoprotein [Candidatus Lokiarchaeota archaeon]